MVSQLSTLLVPSGTWLIFMSAMCMHVCVAYQYDEHAKYTRIRAIELMCTYSYSVSSVLHVKQFFVFGGSSFRPEFSQLGEVWTIIPETTNVMALTATATNSTWASIIRILDMQSPTIVSVHPSKSNIMYYVKEKSSISVSFATICDKVAH